MFVLLLLLTMPAPHVLLPPLQPQLFAGVLSALVGAGRPPAVLDAAVQALLLVFGAETFSGGDENAERAATAATLSALCTLRNRLAGASGEEGAAVGVTQLGSALAERAPEWCGGELPQASGGSHSNAAPLQQAEHALNHSSRLLVGAIKLAMPAPQCPACSLVAKPKASCRHRSARTSIAAWPDTCRL